MKVLVCGLIVAMLAGTASAGMNKAVKAAIDGPAIKKEKVYDHEFNIKKAEKTTEGSRLIVTGHISHHLRWRPDDQVYYTIVKEGNKIISIDRKINRGGLAPIAAPIVAAIGTYLTGTPIPPEQVEEVGRAIGAVVDKKWETASDAIIANIALRIH